MGCTSSKADTNSPTTTISDNNHQLINDQFRQWLKSNRPKADEYVLNNLTSTNQPSNDTEEYRVIVSKALDLISERTDIKTANKLNKHVQKELPLVSSKKVTHTIDVLKQTAEKLHNGQLILDDTQQQTITANGETLHDKAISENKHGQISSTEPGISLKEALEKARILFYKGKQAAIFASPNGGYLVKIIDEDDDTVNHDGNLLRSIVVTEVKIRPKPTAASEQQTSTSKPLDENEIGEDFRRSIDAALKGLESIYHPSSSPNQEHHHHDEKPLTSNEHTTNSVEIDHKQKIVKTPNDEHHTDIDIQPKLVSAIDDMSEMMLDIIETTTESEIGEPKLSTHSDRTEKIMNVERIVKELKEHGEMHEWKGDPSEMPLPSNSNSVTLSKQIQEQIELDHDTHQQSSDVHNDDNNINKQPSHGEITHQIQPNESPIFEADKIEPEPMPSTELTSSPTNEVVTPATHNVTYTEIIHSESLDGEQSRHFKTESYDDSPSTNNDDTTTLKVITKSEFSNHPEIGEKIMEQSVQVTTVKTRNETTTTMTKTPSSATPDADILNEKESIKNETNAADTII